MAFWTYMLKCSDGRYYTGHTDNLDHRIAQHHCGQGSAFTRDRRPVILVWSETFGTRIEALEAERIVGGWSRAKKEALIAGNWPLLSYFARPPKERNVGEASCTQNDVEKPQAQSERVSTSLDTNGCGDAGSEGSHAL